MIPPKFEEVFNGFRVTLYKEILDKSFTDSNKVPDKVPDILSENQMKIIKLINNNNRISMSEMATATGISKRRILDNVNKLKKLNKLKRVGKAKTGYWKIIKNF